MVLAYLCPLNRCTPGFIRCLEMYVPDLYTVVKCIVRICTVLFVRSRFPDSRFIHGSYNTVIQLYTYTAIQFLLKGFSTLIPGVGVFTSDVECAVAIPVDG